MLGPGQVTSAAWELADYATALEADDDPSAPLLSHPRKEWRNPYTALRHSVPLAQLRERGTFFTGEDMARRLWGTTSADLGPGTVIVDPACGAGDLLIPAVATLCATGISDFEVRAGDIDRDFVRIARARLKAQIGHTGPRLVAVERDFLSQPSLVVGATHVVLNPPYVSTNAEGRWANGSVNAAAVFVEKALLSMDDGATLMAVLPDVLRTGSRYGAWRTAVASLCRLTQIEALGQFDAETDVHVFMMTAIKGAPGPHAQWYGKNKVSSSKTVGEVFDIRVGPVVPHRHALNGPTVPFVTARSLTSGEDLERRFGGRLESGPMVLINRTSRPGETPRARARLWTSTMPAAVENHLIVATPKDESESRSACKRLVSVLEDQRTSDYLDDRIRCRHLTVSSVKDIPWLE